MSLSLTTRLPGLATGRETPQPVTASANRLAEEAAISDEVLIGRISGGDREALACLFRRHARTVRGVALRIVRDNSEADDVLQEVFLFIHRKSGMFDRSKSSARSWIVQMTYHRAIDRRRYLQSRHFYTQVDLDGATELHDPYSHTMDTNEFLGELVGNTTIQGLLDTLTEDQRNTLSLHFYEGYTFDEIATKLDQSLGNIRNHYYRGLEKLRKQMFPGKLPGRNGNGRK